jgi:hypothetical protein
MLVISASRTLCIDYVVWEERVEYLAFAPPLLLEGSHGRGRVFEHRCATTRTRFLIPGNGLRIVRSIRATIMQP